MGEDTTLYDDLGGEEAIAAVVDEFYDRVLGDDQLAGYFEDSDVDELRNHQTEFLAAVTGGPVDYTGANMRAAHADLDLGEDDFRRVAGHLEASLAAFDVPAEQIDTVLGEVAELKGAILAE